MNSEAEHEDLVRRLRAIDPACAVDLEGPDEQAQRNALRERAARKLGIDGRAAARSFPSPRPQPALAVALAVALIAAVSLTPPGRAVADQIAELVGIGDDPSVSQHAANETDSVVIGTGSAPNGTSYELAAAVDETNSGPATCVNFDLSAQPKFVFGNCMTDSLRQVLPEEKLNVWVSAAPDELSPDTELLVSGLTVPEVQSVMVSYRTADAQSMEARVDIAALSDELAERIGSPDRLNFYVAFLSPGVLQSVPGQPGVLDRESVDAALRGIEATAYDADGNEIAHRSPIQEPTSTNLLLKPPPQFSVAAKRRLEAQRACMHDTFDRYHSTAEGETTPIQGDYEAAIERCVAERLSEP